MATIQDYAQKSLRKKYKEEYQDARSEGAFKSVLVQVCKKNGIDSTNNEIISQIMAELKNQLTGIKAEQLTDSFADAIVQTGDAKTASLKADQLAKSAANNEMLKSSIALADTIKQFLTDTKANVNDDTVKAVLTIVNNIQTSQQPFDAKSLAKVCELLDQDWNSAETRKNMEIIKPAVSLIQKLGGQVPQLQSLNRPQQPMTPYSTQQQ